MERLLSYWMGRPNFFLEVNFPKIKLFIQWIVCWKSQRNLFCNLILKFIRKKNFSQRDFEKNTKQKLILLISKYSTSIFVHIILKGRSFLCLENCFRTQRHMAVFSTYLWELHNSDTGYSAENPIKTVIKW